MSTLVKVVLQYSTRARAPRFVSCDLVTNHNHRECVIRTSGHAYVYVSMALPWRECSQGSTAENGLPSPSKRHRILTTDASASSTSYDAAKILDAMFVRHRHILFMCCSCVLSTAGGIPDVLRVNGRGHTSLRVSQTAINCHGGNDEIQVATSEVRRVCQGYLPSKRQTKFNGNC